MPNGCDIKAIGIDDIRPRIKQLHVILFVTKHRVMCRISTQATMLKYLLSYLSSREVRSYGHASQQSMLFRTQI